MRAALYLRSSKDRSDVSIDAQRRALQKLAGERQLLIAAEYTDIVESGKDDNRPGFQRLLADLKSPDRVWRALLMYDTSRLARNQYIAHVFRHECQKRGIPMHFAMTPQLDGVAGIILPAVLHAVDEVHSFVSREKGRAGMAENVRRGFRAGGRAPRGYRLKRIQTGAWRDGEEVTKSILEPNEIAPIVTRYLTARALGRARRALRRELNLDWPEHSLVGMEWNALTYAGHTVWNVHAEYDRQHGYKGGHKRRPRGEWIVHRDTHPALITDTEAEAILTQLETSPHGTKRTRHTSAAYLLTGLLRTPEGDAWHGNGAGRYRAKASRRNVEQREVEESVMHQIIEDMRSPDFLRRLTAHAKHVAAQHTGPNRAAPLRAQLADVVARISRTMDLAAGLADPAPALRKVDELEQQRRAIMAEVDRLNADRDTASAIAGITEANLHQQLGNLAERLHTDNRETKKEILMSLLDKVVLDPATLTCELHYQIPVTGRNKMASPRGSSVIPIIQIVHWLKVAGVAGVVLLAGVLGGPATTWAADGGFFVTAGVTRVAASLKDTVLEQVARERGDALRGRYAGDTTIVVQRELVMTESIDDGTAAGLGVGYRLPNGSAIELMVYAPVGLSTDYRQTGSATEYQADQSVPPVVTTVNRSDIDARYRARADLQLNTLVYNAAWPFAGRTTIDTRAGFAYWRVDGERETTSLRCTGTDCATTRPLFDIPTERFRAQGAGAVIGGGVSIGSRTVFRAGIDLIIPVDRGEPESTPLANAWVAVAHRF